MINFAIAAVLAVSVVVTVVTLYVRYLRRLSIRRRWIRFCFPDPDKPDVVNGARLATFAAASYAGTPEAAALVRYCGDEHKLVVVRRGSADVTVVIRAGSNQAIVAIAGTNERSDLRVDADVRPTTVAERRRVHGLQRKWDGETIVHHGFADHAIFIRSALMSIPELKDRQIWIAAHSLGGAAAALLPFFLAADYAAIHTFGSPKPIAKDSPTDPNFGVLRWRRPADIIPLLPAIGFRQPTSTERFIRYRGSVSDSLQWYELAIAAATYGIRRLWSGRRDHSAASYDFDLHDLQV